MIFYFFFFNNIFFSGCCRPTDRFSVLITVQGWGEPSHRQRFDREISAPLPPPRGQAPGPYPGSSVPPLPPQFPLTPRAREGAGRDRNLPGAALHTEVSRGRPLGLTRPTLVRGPGLPSWVGGAPPSPPTSTPAAPRSLPGPARDRAKGDGPSLEGSRGAPGGDDTPPSTPIASSIQPPIPPTLLHTAPRTEALGSAGCCVCVFGGVLRGCSVPPRSGTSPYYSCPSALPRN